MMNITCFVIGMIGTNVYLIQDEATGKLAVIDPADHSDELLEQIEEHGGDVAYILLTHGHYDHIMGVAELCEKYHPTVCASRIELPVIEEPSYNLSKPHGITVAPFQVDRALEDGDTIRVDVRVEFSGGDVIGTHTMEQLRVLDALSEEEL